MKRSLNMKNKMKLIGIIAFVAVIGLLLASCGDKEGTFKLKNETGAEITAYAISADKSPDASDLQKDANKATIKNNETGSWTLAVGTVYYTWSSNTGSVKSGGKIEKGKTVEKSTKD